MSSAINADTIAMNTALNNIEPKSFLGLVVSTGRFVCSTFDSTTSSGCSTVSAGVSTLALLKTFLS